MEEIIKAATALSVLMKLYTIPWHDRGHINVKLVLQSCTDSLQVPSDSSSEMFPTSSDGTHDVGDIKFEEVYVKEEEEEVNVKAEKVIGSEGEECMDIKEEDGLYCEEEEEDLDTNEVENIDIKEEVSWEDTVKHLMK